MKIEEEKLKKWQRLKDKGDIELLSRMAGVSRPIISKALNQGISSGRVIMIIEKYYANKKKQVYNEVD